MDEPTPQSRAIFGAAPALLSAALFGASTPVAKALLGAVDPWMLAALLYLGSGLGLGAYRLIARRMRPAGVQEPSLTVHDWRWFAGAIAAGGVIGPIALMLGLTMTSAGAASLLLNLEGVATALLAWFVFRENVDARIALGMAAIVGGAAVLSWQGSIDDGGLAGPFLIAAACLAWGVDNNLTRKVALSDPVQIAMWKGLIAGGVNLALAALVGAPWPAAGMALTAGVVGLLGYGVSITLFVHALRRIGTARTGAYFSTAPFLGAALAVAWLGEPVTPPLVAAGMLMAIGVGLHLTERHEHAHEHPATAHSHRHRHDEHHRHAHGPDDPAGEPHTHWHAHPAMHHRHAHYPDAHHRHRH